MAWVTASPFCPTDICEDLKLVEKHGKKGHLDLRVSYQHFAGAGPMQEALAAGTIDMATFGVAPLLAAWEKAKGAPGQIFAASGLTTLPLALLTNRPDIHSLSDFRSADRIAVPSPSAPQLYMLQMQSEKVFGQYDKLRRQIVVLPHAEAVEDLVGAKNSVAGYFSSAPYAEIALADSHVHKILSASDVIDGNASFLVLGASKGYIAAHPRVPEAIGKAIDEAARIIRDDPHRAAEIYLAHEPHARRGGACRRSVWAQGRIRQRGARHRSVCRFHGPAWRTQIAARELAGDRRTGAFELAEQLAGENLFCRSGVDLDSA